MKYISARKVAKLLNIHYGTLRLRIYKGKIKPDHEYDDPKRYFFSEKSVEKLLNDEGNHDDKLS